MTQISTLSSNITSSLELGEHHYQDVRVVVEGKLRDRIHLVGKPTRQKGPYGGAPLTEETIANNIRIAMEGMVKSSVQNLLDTATYYREKYKLAI